MAVRTNLIADRTPLVGRAAECAAIGGAIDTGARLVNLVGTPGIGKTQLARSIAAGRFEQHRGGVWFCDLTAARGEADLLAAAASALGVSLRPASDGGSQQLLRALAVRGPILFLLDNFESLVPDALPRVEAWLDGAPELQLLITSRIRLGVAGEVAFELGPLEVEDAVQLYENRAGAAWADRRRDEAEGALVRDLVQRLDCIPLALELAAARIRVLPPGALLERLADRFAILQGPRRGRHASLREAITCSFELLSARERAALLQVSVFRGGFTLDAAAGVIALDEDAPAVLDLLEGLRDKSLLRLDAARFSLYESVREFAAVELAADGGTADAEERHAAFFQLAAESWAALSRGPGGPAAVQALHADRENLLAAQERSREAHPARTARIALALGVGLALQGPVAAEVELFDRAVDAARRAGEPALLARLLHARGTASCRQGRIEEARADLDEALALAAKGAPACEIRIESARLRCVAGDFDGARADLRQAFVGYAAPDAWLVGRASNILGMVEERSGRLEASAAAFEEALAQFRRCGDLRLQGVVLLNLGVVRGGAGRLDEARATLEESLRLLRQVDDRASEADAIVDLGSIELTAGRLDDAEKHLLHALRLERELGTPRFEALALGNLGLVAMERVQLDLAWRRLREALELLRSCGEIRLHSVFLPFYAAVEAAQGRVEEARSDFAEARAWFAPLEDHGSLATIEVLEGFLDLAQGVGARAAAARLQRGRGVASAELVLARRLLGAAIERQDDPRRAPVPPQGGLLVEAEARFFHLPPLGPVDLRRRGPLRRLLHALAEQRLAAPGVGLSPEQLFERGWPGESILPTAASNRVYTGIRALRAMGLESLLQRQADGYLLDPDVPLHRLTT